MKHPENNTAGGGETLAAAVDGQQPQDITLTANISMEEPISCHGKLVGIKTDTAEKKTDAMGEQPPIGNPMLHAALQFAERGKAAFPLRGKVPLTPNGFKDASTEPSVIKAWWKRWPDASIGLPTGAINGFWALDIDGEEGESSLRALEAKHSPIPPTIEVITGGGGRHLYFPCSPDKAIYNSAGRLGKGLDVRGDGGYVVAPPSIHRSGRPYEWSVDCAPMAPCPPWLIDLIQQPPASKSSTTEWADFLQGVSEGSRNESIARVAGLLLASTLQPRIALELCLAWNESRCKPPLSSEEVIRTVASIARIEQKKKGI